MDEQTLFLIFFILMVIAFIYGNQDFYDSLNVTFLKNMDFDDVSWKLMSLGIVSILCSIYWNRYPV
jgi:hypothetical protein